jgi:hypothetical protein
MKRPRFLAVYWVVLTVLLVWAFLLHGQALGGVKYFAHMGAGGSAFLQGALILASSFLAIELASNSPGSTVAAGVVLALSATFAFSIVGGFIPVLGLLVMFLSPYVYPPLALAIQALVLVSAIATFAATGTKGKGA